VQIILIHNLHVYFSSFLLAKCTFSIPPLHRFRPRATRNSPPHIEIVGGLVVLTSWDLIGVSEVVLFDTRHLSKKGGPFIKEQTYPEIENALQF